MGNPKAADLSHTMPPQGLWAFLTFQFFQGLKELEVNRDWWNFLEWPQLPLRTAVS